MKKSAFILLLILLLFASCKTKEERLIIGEWKLVDIKEIGDSTLIATSPWAYYLYDNNKSLTISFNRDQIYTLVKKDGSDSRTKQGLYVVRSEMNTLILRLQDYYSSDGYTGRFDDLVLEKKEMTFKVNHSYDYIYSIFIFKKVK